MTRHQAEAMPFVAVADRGFRRRYITAVMISIDYINYKITKSLE